MTMQPEAAGTRVTETRKFLKIRLFVARKSSGKPPKSPTRTFSCRSRARQINNFAFKFFAVKILVCLDAQNPCNLMPQINLLFNNHASTDLPFCVPYQTFCRLESSPQNPTRKPYCTPLDVKNLVGKSFHTVSVKKTSRMFPTGNTDSTNHT